MRQPYNFKCWGDRIREARGRRPQGWLARVIGVNQSTVSAWEQGRFPPPDDRKLDIAEALGFKVEKLFPWSDVRRENSPAVRHKEEQAWD